MGSSETSEAFRQMTVLQHLPVIDFRRGAVFGRKGCFRRQLTFAGSGSLSGVRDIADVRFHCLIPNEAKLEPIDDI